jgi:hypothetical protein
MLNRKKSIRLEPALNIDETPRGKKSEKGKPVKKKALFSWLSELYSISDTLIVNRCGEEVLFYLKYEKYCAILFFVMSLANTPVTYIYFMSSFDNS